MQIYVQLKNKDHPTVIKDGEVRTHNLQHDATHSLNGFLIVQGGDQVLGMFNITEVAGWWLVEDANGHS